jgi:hypothetical protein
MFNKAIKSNNDLKHLIKSVFQSKDAETMLFSKQMEQIQSRTDENYQALDQRIEAVDSQVQRQVTLPEGLSRNKVSHTASLRRSCTR